MTEFEQFKKVLVKKYFWDVYNRVNGDKQLFVEIVKHETLKDKKRGKNVYKEKVTTQKLL